jgi:hypothetical protein
LLLLAFALALGLSTRTSDKVFLIFLRNRLGIGPFLILLAALVGLAGLGNARTKCKLLLSELSEIIGVGDAVVLWLGLSCGLSGIGWCSIAISSQSLLLFGIGNGFTSLLVSEFGSALVRTPAMAGLLLRITADVRKSRPS